MIQDCWNENNRGSDGTTVLSEVTGQILESLIVSATTETQRIIIEHYEQLSDNKLDNWKKWINS